MNEKQAAGLMLADCMQAMGRTGDSVLTVLLQDVPFGEWEHFPTDDVRDPTTGCRFYYHAHAASERVTGEHGHFHTFATGDDGKLTHLAAVSLDAYGVPFRIFTVNRWVTDDHWRTAEETTDLLSRFVVDAVRPSWVVSRWVTAVLMYCRDDIARLLRERDQVISGLERTAKGGEGSMSLSEILENRRFEVLSECAIDFGSVSSISNHTGLPYSD